VSPFRHLLLVLVLLLAQLAGAAHALEHAVNKEGAPPTHVCELCMVAHDLASALPSLATLPVIPAGRLLPPSAPLVARSDWPAPRAVQRGPPLS
jgi:hypothetical protein